MSGSNFDSDLNNFFGSIDQRLTVYVPDMIAETAVEVFKDSFVTKSWDGEQWPEYGNKEREPKRGSLMRRTNNLVNSIHPSLVSPTLVRINAGNYKVPYARAHNEGMQMSGTRNIRSYYNNNFMGKGKRISIRAHTRSVNYITPRRQFMGKSELLLTTIKTRFINTFKRF